MIYTLRRFLGAFAWWRRLEDRHWRNHTMEVRRGYRHVPDVVIDPYRIGYQIRMWRLDQRRRFYEEWDELKYQLLTLAAPYIMMFMQRFHLQRLGSLELYLQYEGEDPVCRNLWHKEVLVCIWFV